MPISDEQAVQALFALNEQAGVARRKTGTIIAVNGRNASVLLDGEGTSVVTAYRGSFEPATNAGVTIERVVGTNNWRIVGIRDNALSAVNPNRYDFEYRGDVLYFPLALEAINNASFNVSSTGLEVDIYNIQYIDNSGTWQYVTSSTVDLVSYVPASDSVWVIVYVNTSSNTVSVYEHTTTATPDGEWPSAVNGLLASVTDAHPLLAVWLDADMTEWGDAWKVIKRGFSFTGKHIIRIPFTAGDSGSGSAVNAVRVLFNQTNDSSVVGTTTGGASVLGTGEGSLTIPANVLQVGSVLRLTIGGFLDTAVTGDWTWSAELGGSEICVSPTDALVDAQTDVGFVARLDITCRSIGATGTVVAAASIQYISGTDFKGWTLAKTTTTTVDTTGALALDFIINFSVSGATADNTVNVQSATLEHIPPPA